MKLILLSLLLVAMILVVDSAFVPTVSGINDDDSNDAYDCGLNETFNTCGHMPICDWTCENVNEPYITCPPLCVARCICHFGFVRRDGRCVHQNECPLDTE